MIFPLVQRKFSTAIPQSPMDAQFPIVPHISAHINFLQYMQRYNEAIATMFLQAVRQVIAGCQVLSEHHLPVGLPVGHNQLLPHQFPLFSGNGMYNYYGQAASLQQYNYHPYPMRHVKKPGQAAVTGEDPAIFCHICGQTFTVKPSLKRPMGIHGGIEPFSFNFR